MTLAPTCRHPLRTRSLLISLLMALAVPQTHAAVTAQASVTVDWDATGNGLWASDGGQTLIWGAGFDFAQSSVIQTELTVNDQRADADLAQDFSWSPLSAASTFSGPRGALSASGSTAETEFVANSEVQALRGAAESRLEARGYAAHAGRFTVAGAGTLTVSFPYTYLMSLQKDHADEGAYGTVSAYMSLENYGPDPAHNTPPYTQLTSVFDFDNYHQTGLAIGAANLAGDFDGADVVALSLFFADGDKGYFAIGFRADTYAYTPAVPLPGGLLLFGSALAACATRIGRKRDAAG